MAGILGWINLVLILFMGSIFPIKKMYQKHKTKKLLDLYKTIRKIHPFMGLTIIIIGIIHGYMQLNTIRIHTGTLILLMVILMGSVALLGPRIKILKRNWRFIHRNMGFLLLGTLVIHLFFNSLI